MTDGPPARALAFQRAPSPVGQKLTSLAALTDLVPDGSVVGIGGTWLSARPMAAVRQLLRAGRRRLHVVSLTGSLDVELLVGAGAADRVTFCFVSLGPFGLAPQFRHAAEEGVIALDEHSGHGLTSALEAASRRLDFTAFHGPAGTSLADRYPTVPSPVTGSPVQVAAAMPLDVAILHAEAATPDGHVLLNGTVGTDVITARAARRVVITAERVVDRLPSSGSRYLPAAEVHHVIEAPWGAHPLAAVPDYGMDWRALLRYARSAADPAGFAEWLRTDLAEGEEQRRARLRAGSGAALRRAGAGGPSRPRRLRGTGRVRAILAHERIIAELARGIHDGDVAVLGSFTPIGYAAVLLAQRTHAPSLDFIAYGFAAADVGWLGFLGAEGRAHRSGLGPLRFEELVGCLRFGGLVAFEPVRPAQVDGTGAMNLRWLRTARGRVRLPGAAGAQEVAEMHTRPVAYLPRHTTRTCVARVDDVTLRAHLPHDRRDAFRFVTDLAVLEFTRTGWRVVSRHAGVSPGALQAATAFPLQNLAGAPETPEPQPAVLAMLREQVDPLGLAATETTGSRDRHRELGRLLEAEERLMAAD